MCVAVVKALAARAPCRVTTTSYLNAAQTRALESGKRQIALSGCQTNAVLRVSVISRKVPVIRWMISTASTARLGAVPLTHVTLACLFLSTSSC